MKEPAHMPDAQPPRSSGEDSTFFKRVERLAERHQHDPGVFHRTRRPFTRLRDILGQIRAARPIGHPSHCQNSDCGKPLRDHYYRRADGYVLCETCFEKIGG